MVDDRCITIATRSTATVPDCNDSIHQLDETIQHLEEVQSVLQLARDTDVNYCSSTNRHSDLAEVKLIDDSRILIKTPDESILNEDPMWCSLLPSASTEELHCFVMTPLLPLPDCTEEDELQEFYGASQCGAPCSIIEKESENGIPSELAATKTKMFKYEERSLEFS